MASRFGTLSDKIHGYIELGETKSPFIFQDGILSILPGTVDEWKKQRRNLFASFHRKYSPEHEWIRDEMISGITSDNRAIEFLADGTESNNNGFLEYEIQRWFIYDPKEQSPKSIDGVFIEGEEVNLFFDPGAVFNSQVTYNDESASRIQVSTEEEKRIFIGKYILDEVTISISIRALATIHFRSDTPFTSKSEVIAEFSHPISIEQVNNVIFDIKRFFYFICYRTNISFSNIQTYSIQDGKRVRAGRIYFNNDIEAEVNKRKNERLLRSNILNIDVSPLLQAISCDELYFEHICPSIKQRSYYGHARMILILSSFEREFKNIYADTFVRSEEYITTKNKVIDALQELRNTVTGKQKQYITGFQKLIQNSDYSFAERLNYVLTDCNEILLPFLDYEYGKGSDDINNLPHRINQFRNDLAHCNIEIDLSPVCISDLHILEIILYTIRLKSIGVLSINIQHGINDLFGYHIAFE